MSLSRTERRELERQRRRRRNSRLFAGLLALIGLLLIAAVVLLGYNILMSRPALPASSGIEAGAGMDEAASAGQQAGGSSQGQARVGNSSGSKPETAVPTEGAARNGNASGIGTAGQGAAGGGASVPEKASSGDEPRVTMAFVGDVMWASTVEDVLKRSGYDYPYLEVRELLQKADISIANLETPVTDRGKGTGVNAYEYKSSPKALSAFKEAGFDVVNLANNHILDYGVTGLLDTIKHLDAHGLRYFGAGSNIEAAYEPAILEVNGFNIAFLGFSRFIPVASWKAGKNQAGVAETYSTILPLEAIRKAKAAADFVIVVPHWGVEREDTPANYQKNLAYQYIDAGADLIVGGHPHVLQGFETYKGKWIAYSLGNFIFTKNPLAKTWDSAILQASCGKISGCSLNVVPVLTELANPKPLEGEAAAKLLARLSSLSINAKVLPDGSVRAKE
ncbi:CapA family protein [Paenibacillus sp. y28]|uniref:CapA family protein n=1 Tax=Paenibacillus sp. y28 TaxID=3129110 RepID=UPI00301925EF